MVIQLIRVTVLLSFLFWTSMDLSAQNKNNTCLYISTNLQSQIYSVDDTISFVVSNPGKTERWFIIETINYDSNMGMNEVYTAYFNYDYSFFKKIKKYANESQKHGINFIMPEANRQEYLIKPEGDFKFSFCITEKNLKKGCKIRLRITPDLVEDEECSTILTTSFVIQ